MDRTTPGFDYAHVTADMQVAAGPGMLHSIVVNGPPDTDGVLTIYDSLTEAGDEIGIITFSIADAISQQVISLLYDINFETGLYFGYDGTLVQDLTVSYVA